MGVPQLEFEVPKTRFDLLCFTAEWSSLLFDLAIHVLIGKEGGKSVRFQLAAVQAAPERQGSQAVRKPGDRPRQLLERRRSHQATSPPVRPAWRASRLPRECGRRSAGRASNMARSRGDYGPAFQLQ